MKTETINRVLKFRDDRNWKQFHNPKDLAISLSLEASELLEVFQWSGTDLECSEKRDNVAEELADVLCYSILMADACGLDLDEIVQKKILRNEQKYPISKAYGRKDKYTAYWKDKYTAYWKDKYTAYWKDKYAFQNDDVDHHAEP